MYLAAAHVAISLLYVVRAPISLLYRQDALTVILIIRRFCESISPCPRYPDFERPSSMGQQSSSSNMTEHRNSDPETDRIIAQLWLEDIDEISAARNRRPETRFDEEIALSRQQEFLEDVFLTGDDHNAAEALSHDIDPGFLRADSIFEQVNRRVALVPSNTGQPPLPSEAWRFKDHPEEFITPCASSFFAPSTLSDGYQIFLHFPKSRRQSTSGLEYVQRSIQRSYLWDATQIYEIQLLGRG